jgi:signal transduction histidine kinase/ActR/RegA family two-component response regulator
MGSNGICLRGYLYCVPRSLHELLVLQAVRLIRLEVFHNLSQRLSGESVGGYLGDCLDALLTGTAAKSAIAFTVDDRLELVADRGLDASRRPLAALLRGASAFAERALATRKPVRAVDLRADRDGVDDAGEFVALGTPSVLAVPLLDLRTPIGAFVLLFANPNDLDLETVMFASSIANLAALRSQRDRHRGEKLSTEQQEETAHMVSLGLLTATVAHELRGPAGALLLQQEELKRLVEQLDLLDGGADTAIGEAVAELSELSTDIGTAVNRVRETVEQLSTVSRRELAPEHVELSEVVEESLTVVKPHFERRGIRLVSSFDPNCYTIARRDNLVQVVLNLTLNAMDACQGSAQPEVAVRVLEAGEHVALVVEDNGPGVPDSAIPHIFKPFYTTKERGAGTGLGLKICADVVSGHGGHIEVHQRSGGGASFRVLLPRAREDSGLLALPVPAPLRAAPPVPTRRKHVLVVDDDPVFSRTIRRSLKPHDVKTCAAASEAQAILLDPAYAPDLVLCDVFLPGANGNLLHARIAKHRPEIARRFVFVTGGALGKDEASYLRASGCTTLVKPVELRSLLELLEDPNPASSPPNTVKTLLQEPPSSSNRSPSVR